MEKYIFTKAPLQAPYERAQVCLDQTALGLTLYSQTEIGSE